MSNADICARISAALVTNADPAVWLAILDDITRAQHQLARLEASTRAWVDVEMSRMTNPRGLPTRQQLDQFARVLADNEPPVA